jgi:uncharacterized protein (TIGR00255 family)
MLRSMTGFGKAERSSGSMKIVVEIKALNSKQLDLMVRMPSELRILENDIRLWASNNIIRGKADISVSMENESQKSNTRLDFELAKQYHEQLLRLSNELQQPLPTDIISLIVKLPGFFNGESQEIGKEEQVLLMALLDEAFAGFDRFRMKEGKALKVDLQARITRILELKEQLTPFELQRKETVRQRLMKNLIENVEKEKIDTNRFEQELLYYLEKMDITEEQVRLGQHCLYFTETLSEEGAGRKLGFISQEIGREINTLGSKANDADIQRLVVQMKDELEKIKEQLFNIL